ncbi:MAG: exodeoxyribonuclease VII small subunit [Candidatus Pacebacteria bacterium]|nr:exodeoxyribonuclease VII small subunit [Candidatus Paceibacterota bacterium]
MTKEIKNSLNDTLKKLEKISAWFDEQEEIDLEKGLEKVREGAVLIRESRKKLKNIENEFEEIKTEMEK